MIKLINATPHPINIIGNKGRVIKIIPKSENPIRLRSDVVRIGIVICDIPISSTIFSKPEGLPKYNKDTFYIVSQLIKSALPKRKDLLVPAELVRDKSGNIIGCKSLGK